MFKFDSLPSAVRDDFLDRLSLEDILKLSVCDRSAFHHCVSFLHDHPRKWLMKAVAAKSVPAVVQVLGHLPCKREVLQLLLPSLLKTPDIPQTVVELLVEGGAVPSQHELMAAVEAGVPGLEMWHRACKALGVPIQLSYIIEMIWRNSTMPVRTIGTLPLTRLQAIADVSGAFAVQNKDYQ
jgi:hypothetical protein